MSRQSFVTLDQVLGVLDSAWTLDSIITNPHVVGEDQEAEDLLRLARLLKEAQEDFDEQVIAYRALAVERYKETHRDAK